MARRESPLLGAIRKILSEGEAGTQEEICQALKVQGLEVTQSTVSRALRKIGAIRYVDGEDRVVYRISDLGAPQVTTGLSDLVLDISSNGSIIVIRTTPGSASLIARHLDHSRPGEILGTIAGDDTIFVAPISLEKLSSTVDSIRSSLQNQ